MEAHAGGGVSPLHTVPSAAVAPTAGVSSSDPDEESSVDMAIARAGSET